MFFFIGIIGSRHGLLALESRPLLGGKRIIDERNSKAFEILGKVGKLSVIGFAGTRVWTIEEVQLTALELRHAFVIQHWLMLHFSITQRTSIPSPSWKYRHEAGKNVSCRL